MSAPGVDKATERSFGDVAQTVSEQALVLLRQELARTRRELTAKAGEASTGAAMVGGAALLGTLATGTGTAALVLFLSRRRESSAAALGVTGLYAGAGALLAREGITRLRAAGPVVPEEPVQSAKNDRGST
jgi:Putative Actinobacterial Holin-X, holin superfamily III